MKFAFWLNLLIGLSSLCLAQSRIDSLKEAQKKAKKNNVATYLSNIGWEFLEARQYDSALFYYYQSIQTPSEDLKMIASTMDCMGVAYSHKGFADSTIVYYNKALQVYEMLNDTASIIMVNTNLSILYKNSGLYEKSLKSAFRAIARLERQEPDRTLASCYNTVAGVYKVLKDFPNALSYYEKSLRIRSYINYSKGVSQSYNNIGETYIQMHQHDSALVYLLKSAEIKREINDFNALGNSLNLIGRIYLSKKELRRAEPYLLEALKIEEQSGERIDQIEVLNNLGCLYLEQNNLIAARRYLQEGEMQARQTNSMPHLRYNLELNAKLYKALRLYPKAIKYAEELIIIKDSLLNKDKAESLIALQTRYETEKKEQQIYLLEQDKVLQQIEIKSKQNWIATLIITIGMATIIALLLLIGYKSSQRNKTKVETLLKELHHRVKNNLQILSSLLGLQAQYIKDEDAVLAIKSNESRVNTMALIHRKLYKDDNYRTIDLKEYISELCAYLLHTYGFTEKVQVNLTSEPILIDVDKAIPVGLIMNEWIGNALKHAYAKEPSPQLNISLRVYHQKELEIKVGDNGMGMPIEKSQEDYQSFGLKMVNILIRELKGKLEVNTKEGTNYTLQLPLT